MTTAGSISEADHSRAGNHTLDHNGKPQSANSVGERWLEWMQAHDQRLAATHAVSGVRVSTRFLGMDQQRPKIGAPVLCQPRGT